MNRHYGVLLHITSLPGGLIGTFGAEARQFVDTLAAAGYDRWQVLPLTPPDSGGSPYSSVGAFALSRL
ncbi:MAG: 4-alpha-glucanotransferase, partial [Bradymonadia bacterium]